MLIGGVIAIIAGIISVIVGFVKNNSLSSQLSSMLSGGSGNPGTIWIIIGIVLVVLGVALVVLQMRKNSSK